MFLFRTGSERDWWPETKTNNKNVWLQLLCREEWTSERYSLVHQKGSKIRFLETQDNIFQLQLVLSYWTPKICKKLLTRSLKNGKKEKTKKEMGWERLELSTSGSLNSYETYALANCATTPFVIHWHLFYFYLAYVLYNIVEQPLNIQKICCELKLL